MPAGTERASLPRRASDLAAAPARSERRGVSAAGGVALGQAFLAEPVDAGRSSPAGLTRESLLEAIAVSARDLDRLMVRADSLGRELFEFQAEMLRDPALAEMALQRIERGEPVALAWASAMDDYMAAFDDDGDERRARNMDLVDIRNRVLGVLSGMPRPGFPAGSVFVADDIEPSVFLDHNWNAGGGLALRGGSTSGHVAMLARAYGVPMVTGLGAVEIEADAPLLLDGHAGTVVLHPDERDVARVERAGGKATAPLANVTLLATVNRMSDLDRIDASTCQGIGLVRTEFLLRSPADFLNEEHQTALYAEIARRSPGPAWIRLLDLGGDKPVDGFSAGEKNPFLGMRGVRLLLAQPHLLKVQARALLRAAVDSKLGVLVPMVTVPEELAAVRAAFAGEKLDLESLGMDCAMPRIGMMVETPAAALMLDCFAADFFAIGSSDLLQYVAAAARSDQSLARLRDQALPAMMRLIRGCAETARAIGKPISLCGDLAGDPRAAILFRDAGIATLSVDPGMLAAVARRGAGDG